MSSIGLIDWLNDKLSISDKWIYDTSISTRWKIVKRFIGSFHHNRFVIKDWIFCSSCFISCQCKTCWKTYDIQIVFPMYYIYILKTREGMTNRCNTGRNQPFKINKSEVHRIRVKFQGQRWHHIPQIQMFTLWYNEKVMQRFSQLKYWAWPWRYHSRMILWLMFELLYCRLFYRQNGNLTT